MEKKRSGRGLMATSDVGAPKKVARTISLSNLHSGYKKIIGKLVKETEPSDNLEKLQKLKENVYMSNGDLWLNTQSKISYFEDELFNALPNKIKNKVKTSSNKPDANKTIQGYGMLCRPGKFFWNLLKWSKCNESHYNQSEGSTNNLEEEKNAVKSGRKDSKLAENSNNKVRALTKYIEEAQKSSFQSDEDKILELYCKVVLVLIRDECVKTKVQDMVADGVLDLVNQCVEGLKEIDDENGNIIKKLQKFMKKKKLILNNDHTCDFEKINWEMVYKCIGYYYDVENEDEKEIVFSYIIQVNEWYKNGGICKQDFKDYSKSYNKERKSLAASPNSSKKKRRSRASDTYKSKGEENKVDQTPCNKENKTELCETMLADIRNFIQEPTCTHDKNETRMLIKCCKAILLVDKSKTANESKHRKDVDSVIDKVWCKIQNQSSISTRVKNTAECIDKLLEKFDSKLCFCDDSCNSTCTAHTVRFSGMAQELVYDYFSDIYDATNLEKLKDTILEMSMKQFHSEFGGKANETKLQENMALPYVCKNTLSNFNRQHETEAKNKIDLRAQDIAQPESEKSTYESHKFYKNDAKACPKPGDMRKNDDNDSEDEQSCDIPDEHGANSTKNMPQNKQADDTENQSSDSGDTNCAQENDNESYLEENIEDEGGVTNSLLDNKNASQVPTYERKGHEMQGSQGISQRSNDSINDKSCIEEGNVPCDVEIHKNKEAESPKKPASSVHDDFPSNIHQIDQNKSEIEQEEKKIEDNYEFEIISNTKEESIEVYIYANAINEISSYKTLFSHFPRDYILYEYCRIQFCNKLDNPCQKYASENDDESGLTIFKLEICSEPNSKVPKDLGPLLKALEDTHPGELTFNHIPYTTLLETHKNNDSKQLLNGIAILRYENIIQSAENKTDIPHSKGASTKANNQKKKVIASPELSKFLKKIASQASSNVPKPIDLNFLKSLQMANLESLSLACTLVDPSLFKSYEGVEWGFRLRQVGVSKDLDVSEGEVRAVFGHDVRVVMS